MTSLVWFLCFNLPRITNHMAFLFDLCDFDPPLTWTSPMRCPTWCFTGFKQVDLKKSNRVSHVPFTCLSSVYVRSIWVHVSIWVHMGPCLTEDLCSWKQDRWFYTVGTWDGTWDIYSDEGREIRFHRSSCFFIPCWKCEMMSFVSMREFPLQKWYMTPTQTNAWYFLFYKANHIKSLNKKCHVHMCIIFDFSIKKTGGIS